MSVNIWAQVGASTFTLVMEALYGTSDQLLGMNSAANALQYKNLTFDNIAGQLANTVGAVGAPAYVFQGDLDTGWYRPAAAQWAWSAAGAQKLLMAAGGFTFSAALQLSGSLIKEDYGADIVAAATTDLGTATGNIVNITNAAGATTITSLGGATLPAGTEIETVISIIAGSVTIVHDATSLILLGGTSLTLVDKDVIRWRKVNDSAAYWLMVGLQRGVNSSILANKGDIVVGTLSGSIIIPGTQVLGLPGQVLTVDTDQNTGLIYVDNPSRPLLNINPNWNIDQIFEGALSTYSSGTGRIADGWWMTINGGGVFKCRVVADPENASLKCLQITCTTADATIAATEFYYIYTNIEGYDAASLMIGTASAQSLTIQFRFKSTVTGVYGVAVLNSLNNRRYISTITVPDTGEHDYTVSLTMDTTGTWLYTNDVGFKLRLTLAAGTDLQAAADSWGAGSQVTTSAQVNFMSNTSNIAYLKRVQILPGATVQPYKPADIQQELAKCKRYYEKTFVQGLAPAQNVGTSTGELSFFASGAASGSSKWSQQYMVEKRANPTITFYNPSALNAQVRDISASLDCSATAAQLGNARSFMLFCTSNAGSAYNNTFGVHWTSDAWLV